MNTTIESDSVYDLSRIVRDRGRHTVCYTVNASEYFADHLPQSDSCRDFAEMMGDSIIRVEKGDFLMRVVHTYYEGDGRNEPRYECEESMDVSIRFCPICGAELVLGDDIIEDGDGDDS